MRPLDWRGKARYIIVRRRTASHFHWPRKDAADDAGKAAGACRNAPLSSGVSAPSGAVQLLQTHIFFVLLAGDYVRMIKKPADMGFLDYTTPEMGRFYCEEEVRLNSRLCSDTYLGVVAIATADGKIVLDAARGTVVDYVVKMRRRPEERVMERLLAENAVSSGMITRLAGQPAAFHQSLESRKPISTFGGTWQENFDQTD
jgi:aminoglycoside phosphotransferase family enzyme